MKAIGLEMFTKESPSNSVTAINAPKGLDGQEIYKNLRVKYGITAAGGQGQAKGKIFRIARLGYADTFDVITAIAGVEMTGTSCQTRDRRCSCRGIAAEVICCLHITQQPIQSIYQPYG